MKSFCYVLFLVNVGSVLLRHSTTRLRTQWAQLNRSILKDIEIEAPVAEAAHAGLWDHFDNTVSLSPSLARKIHGFVNVFYIGVSRDETCFTVLMKTSDFYLNMN